MSTEGIIIWSRRLGTLWDWRTASGQLKDRAARTLLLKLQEQGSIQLPERSRESPTRSGRAPAQTPLALLDETRFEGSLASLLPLRMEELSQLGRHARRAQLEACVARYHYLGYRSRVGQNLQCWTRRPAATLLGEIGLFGPGVGVKATRTVAVLVL